MPQGYISENLARACAGGPCSTEQSSTYHVFPASYAVDGITTADFVQNLWCTHTTASHNTWWRVDFGVSRRVQTVRIYNRGSDVFSRLEGFSISVGESTDWRLNSLCAQNQPAPGAPSYVADVPCVGQGRYLHVVIIGTSKMLTLCEVQVFGPGCEQVNDWQS